MMKATIFFIILLFIFSCTNIEENKHTKVDSITYYKSSMFDTKIVLINVENVRELDAIPHFVINKEDVGESDLFNYIKARSVESRGEKQILKTGFNVKKEYDVSQLDRLISITQKSVVDLHPEFSGVLEIVVRYSTKGNSWLELPPPPK